MAVLGIIAEFNPFHNGHLHLLEEAHQQDNFTATICVMSGNFLQRGEPALCNKWARAEMALKSGVDLVIELPFCFTTRSAYYFARGAIQLLTRTGVVTHLAFGSESGNMEKLRSIATIIAHEPEEYQRQLRRHLSRGLSFPVARSLALQQFSSGLGSDGIGDMLIMPNNILAIEYLRVIEEESAPLTPLTITRKDSGYHSTLLSRFASASAIRHALSDMGDIRKVAPSLPPDSLNILKREIRLGRAPVLANSMAQAILLKLRTIPLEQLRNIYEITEGLEYRIKQAAISSSRLDELKQAIKSKRYSLTRINRILLYSLCDLSKNQVEVFDQHGPLYLHILGFSAKGQEILQEIKNNSQIAVFNRASNVKTACKKGSDIMSKMVKLDVWASDIYTLFYPETSQRKGALDFTTSPVRI